MDAFYTRDVEKRQAVAFHTSAQRTVAGIFAVREWPVVRPLAAVVAVENDLEVGVVVDCFWGFVEIKARESAGTCFVYGIFWVRHTEVVEGDVGLRLVHVVGIHAVFFINRAEPSQLFSNGIPLFVGER